MKRVMLAYSGGLDTSVIVPWLQETYGAEVVTYTADVGQGEEVGDARAKAVATGAVEAVVDDLRADFVQDYVFPAMRANAVASLVNMKYGRDDELQSDQLGVRIMADAELNDPRLLFAGIGLTFLLVGAMQLINDFMNREVQR